jgi:bifunctional enzyme CysN/CysC
VAVNKMDLVGYSQARFEEIVGEFEGFAERLHRSTRLGGLRRDIIYLPISALHGDNVVERSQAMDWYEGRPLLELLETVEVTYDHPYEIPARFPVQWVIRPGAAVSAGPLNGHHAAAARDEAAPAGAADRGAREGAAGADYRGYAGQLSTGALRVGDEVVVLPSGQRTRIAAIDTYDGPLQEALAPMSVTLRLADELDVSRGELICRPSEQARVTRELEADLCWMSEQPLRPGGRYVLKHTTRQVGAIVDALHDRVDIHSFERSSAPGALELNDIGRVSLRTSAPLAADPYEHNRRTGGFILIDETSNGTVGAGMIRAS